MNDSICSYPTCARPRGNNGSLSLCAAHYQRKRTGKDMDAPIKTKAAAPLVERFWRYVPTGLDPFECWEWQGMRNHSNYGQLRKDSSSVKLPAHRLSYEIKYGPIPDRTGRGLRLVVCHACDNPPCVNPHHLFVGTDRDNMVDKTAKGRGIVKLTPDDVREIRGMYATGEYTQRQIGDLYGVTKTQIGHIVRRKQWADVE